MFPFGRHRRAKARGHRGRAASPRRCRAARPVVEVLEGRVLLTGGDLLWMHQFGSAAKDTGDTASDLDLAVSGLPPSVFYRIGARVSDLIGRSVDLIDLDINTPFTRHSREENELIRVG